MSSTLLLRRFCFDASAVAPRLAQPAAAPQQKQLRAAGAAKASASRSLHAAAAGQAKQGKATAQAAAQGQLLPKSWLLQILQIHRNFIQGRH